MNNMIITFKKNKNKENEYIIIFNSMEFPDNIIMYFILDLYGLKRLMEFINMLQNYYKISYFDIEIDCQEIELNSEIDSVLRYCPF